MKNNEKNDESDKNNEELIYLEDRNGNIFEDIPKKVLSAKLKEDKSVDFLILWKKISRNKLSNSYVSNEDMKKNKYFDLIIDFYESRLRFQNENFDSKKTANSNDSTNNDVK